MSFEMKNWQNPPAKNRVNPIVHGWPESRTELMDAVKAFGFGGVVTNPSHENWYEGYRNNVREFKSVMKELDDETSPTGFTTRTAIRPATQAARP